MIAVLSKCIEELKAESPRLDYVLGMLESVVEMRKPSELPVGSPPIRIVTPLPKEEPTDAEKAYLHGSTGTVT